MGFKFFISGIWSNEIFNINWTINPISQHKEKLHNNNISYFYI